MADVSFPIYDHDLDWYEMYEVVDDVTNGNAYKITEIMDSYGVDYTDINELGKYLEGTSAEIYYNADGTRRAITGVSDYTHLSSAGNISSSINSNTVSSAKVTTKVETPMNTTLKTNPATGVLTKEVKFANVSSGGLNFVFNTVAPAVVATGAGITLGKAIDKALYNANPDFWDNHGLSSLNPDTWNNITSDLDDDSWLKRGFNVIFGLNNETQSAQMYVDENALSYMAYYMQTMGVFDEARKEAEYEETVELLRDYEMPLNVGTSKIQYFVAGISEQGTRYGYIHKYVSDYDIYTVLNRAPYTYGSGYTGNIITVSNHPFSFGRVWTPDVDSYDINAIEVSPASIETTYNGNTFYHIESGFANEATYPSIPYNNEICRDKDTGRLVNMDIKDIGTIVLDGTITSVGIEGISDQPSAVLPVLINATDPSSTLALLKEQYPELWDNAVTNSVVQDDGSVVDYTYVPVATPNMTDKYDLQPTSGTGTQQVPQVNPQTSPQSLLNTIINFLTPTITTGTNPMDTGEGSTPAVVPPTGTASALWSVYNPTESETKQFGGWLWSPNFVDQILKMFTHPMEAIISLHKVFCTPITGGRETIKVGYLASNTSAKTVTNQYVTIDCGSVKVQEYFFNVFDYDPYTKISLYLPFIGIVRLNTADIMRSRVSVVYHIDVYTGSCLAEVKVTRDSAGGTLYQYTGNCAVQYPLSSGSYLGVVGGAVGIGLGIATGGVVGLGMGVSSLSRARTEVQMSGSLSGNAGAMGIKKPYIIISRPQPAMATNFEEYVGIPSNYTTTIGSCTGFTQVTACHIDDVKTATDEEKDMIQRELLNGIIIR